MKILQINKFFYIRGGSERVFFDTIRILENQGHEVINFSMKDEKNFPSKYSDFFIENIDFTKKRGIVEDFPKAMHFLYSWEARRKLEKLIKQEKPDIAHLHNFTHQLTVSVLAVLEKYNIPVVQTLHDYQMICPNARMFTHGQICERCKNIRFYRAVSNKCVQYSYGPSVLSSVDLYLQRVFGLYKERVAQFVAPSKFMMNKTKEWGIENDIMTIPYSVNLSGYQPNYVVGDYLVFIGRLSSEKGLLTLLQAVRKLPKVKLKIVGTGPKRAYLAEFIRKKQIKNVELLGVRHGAALQDIIKHSRFVVVPSEWYENYPMAILEAMAFGKPVLGARIGGISEMIKEDVTGWLFESGNMRDLRKKITLVYPKEDLIRDCGERARKTVEQQNREEVYYKKLMDVYEFLLENPGLVG